MDIEVASPMIRSACARPSGVFLSFIVLVIAVASALAVTFPALTGRVVDEAGILDSATKAALEQKLADFEAKTTGQPVVVTLKSLQGTSIEDYGYQIGRYWQIGQKDKNTGALLIIAPNERKVRIEVGYGFEGTLTDAVSKLIIENAIVPRLRVNDFAGGINRGVDDIIQAVSILISAIKEGRPGDFLDSTAPACTAGTAASSPPINQIEHGHRVFRPQSRSEPEIIPPDRTRANAGAVPRASGCRSKKAGAVAFTSPSLDCSLRHDYVNAMASPICSWCSRRRGRLRRAMRACGC
jgi:hypothetical protein